MIGYNGIDNWDDSVELVEIATKVLGGISGPSNLGIKNLANRTVYLKTRVQELDNSIVDVITELESSANDMALHISNSNPHPQYILKSGDSMSGFLTLHSDPSSPLHAVTKQYVDTNVDLKLPLSGGTMSGFITLHSTPTANLHAATKQYVDTQIATQTSSVPVSTIIYVASPNAPAGYLKANGSQVSRTTYSALFAAIGTYYGAGNGSTTFNLPDLRGEFIRGWDDGRGLDSGRGFATTQTAQVAEHTHYMFTSQFNISGGQIVSSPNSRVAFKAANIDPDNYDYTMGSSSGTAAYGVTSVAGGADSRPRNMVMLACIKY